ncbi:TRAP transporter large permease [Salipiger sp. P9]|uniref:TRAP transporter large permease n=1 Tax=Salipiger pentaromativorans TaxID=2943193 RepID=UPI002157EE94|nr:TRAP transporter large permease [Salipiger pentaromativorans]MCR8551109.1 TRAP transporter large permease [Salipiger pentaromativorans]
MAISAGITLLIALLLFGLPVAFTLMVAGVSGLYLLIGPGMVTGILSTSPLASIQLYELTAIPMFILMANLIIASGISDDLFNVAKTWTGRVPGGLAHATVLTGAAFGAISGSSTAAAATLSSTSIPGMVKQGYDARLASGVAAISGTLAMLIPPSVAMVLYAVIADISVSKLLIAGLAPGLLVTLTIMATVLFLVWRAPDHAPAAERYTLREKLVSMRAAWPFLLLFALVTGAIYLGIATATETSALGALAATLLCLHRRVPLRELHRALVAAAEASCMIALILIGASIFGYFITLSHIAQDLMTYVGAAGLNRWLVLLIIVVTYILLGCVMDLITMMIVTVPIAAPLMLQLGFDPYWFAVITIIAGEVGMVTPPLGLNVFVISKYTGIPVTQVFRGAYPHVIAHLALILLLSAVPALVTWLPSTMN